MPPPLPKADRICVKKWCKMPCFSAEPCTPVCGCLVWTVLTTECSGERRQGWVEKRLLKKILSGVIKSLICRTRSDRSDWVLANFLISLHKCDLTKIQKDLLTSESSFPLFYIYLPILFFRTVSSSYRPCLNEWNDSVNLNSLHYCEIKVCHFVICSPILEKV